MAAFLIGQPDPGFKPAVHTLAGAAFTGTDTGRQARIPIAPFMGICGVAPLRKGMYRTFPPSVSGGCGGNTDIRQLVKGARLQLRWLSRVGGCGGPHDVTERGGQPGGLVPVNGGGRDADPGRGQEPEALPGADGPAAFE